MVQVTLIDSCDLIYVDGKCLTMVVSSIGISIELGIDLSICDDLLEHSPSLLIEGLDLLSVMAIIVVVVLHGQLLLLR